MEDIEGNFGLAIVKHQIFAALIACYVIFCYGCNMGFLSPALPVLLSNNTPLASGPLTYTELSWIGSIISIGAVAGTFITGLLSILYGSKRTIVFLAFPVIISWLFIHFGNNVYHILLAMFTSGVTGGGFSSGVVLFISEVSNDNVRGRLGSLVPLANNLGVLMGYIGGALIEYEHRPYVFISLPILYLFLVYFLPSTPQYHLKAGNLQSAEKSLKYYKGCTGETDREKTHLKSEFERMKLLEEERKNCPKLQLKDFCNWSAFKGIVTCMAMSWFTSESLFISYASMIFKISQSAFSPDISAIILAIVQIIGGLTSTQIGDAFGRKTILFTSLLGLAFGLFVFSTYLYLLHHSFELVNYAWLPVVCLSFAIFSSSAGISAIANTCVIENFPTKIRPVGMVFYSTVNNLVAFVVGKSFPILLEIIYLHGFMFLLAINCCLGIIFVLFMKETKGKSLDTLVMVESK
ncbi:facilitated trehalose transporter Tret1-like [Sitodiplosis mosellana]|uniref:facilitated trehalose transporter Tret1-like n=1 Tax=Sitodiplosis mosellana TaxID=263140 RepID=UPI0024450E01|nr:facilitated trehalose transporter Tret1-like [Sitodiplosis mosellana]